MGWGAYYIRREELSRIRRGIIDGKRQINGSNAISVASRIYQEFILPVLKVYQPIVSKLAENRGGIFYRARKCLSSQPFEKITDLYNAPAPSGRAFAGSNAPLLYASSSIQTALAEIDVAAGDFANIVHFNYSSSDIGDFWFVNQLAEHYRSNEISRYLATSDGVLKCLYLPSGVRTLLAFTDNLINEIFSVFSSEADGYILNRMMINEIMQKPDISENFSGVVYRSVKDSPGLNFAVLGDTINKLTPSTVNFVRIAYVDEYKSISYEHLGNSQSRNGKLSWPS